MFSHLRRIAVSLAFLFGVGVLVVLIDSVGYEMVELNRERGVQDGPFSMPFAMMESIMFMVVAILIVGIIIWVLIGPIQQTRREEEYRRIR